ncbi:MAG TPA: flagellar protein FlaG [Burkholderiaceae bacterium]|nr:flagellar protein FlaG [Burkholderiaceae bacterium]
MAIPPVSGMPGFPAVSTTGGTDHAPTNRPPEAVGPDSAMPAGTVGGHGGASADATPTPLDKAITLANSSLEAWSTGMRFDIDPTLGRVVISITDSRTGKVLRTVPTDAVLRVAKMILQMREKPIDTKA